MRVLRVTKAGRERSDNPIFVGEVDYQTAVGEESRDLRLSEVSFKRGAVNKPHAHTTDQILLNSGGAGPARSRARRAGLGRRPTEPRHAPLGGVHGPGPRGAQGPTRGPRGARPGWTSRPGRWRLQPAGLDSTTIELRR